MNKIGKISLTILKILGWILLGLVVLALLLVLFIRSPWGQGIIKDKAIGYVTDRTDTKVELERLFVTFSGNIFIEGLYIEDQQADTLLYSKSLETGVAFLPLIKDGAIHVSKLEWDGLKAHVVRTEETGKFNFDFILEALMAETDTADVAPSEPDTVAGNAPDIQLGPITIQNVDISYLDEVMGMDGVVKLGYLFLRMESMDLGKMHFYIGDFLLNDSDFYYKQSKPFEEVAEKDTTSTPMPLVIIDRMAIEDVHAYYESVPDGTLADVTLGEFLVELPEANLGSNKVLLKTLSLHKSEVVFKMGQGDVEENEPQTNNEEQAAGESFEWPGWNIDIGKISLADNRIQFQSGIEDPKEGVFNPAAIGLDRFNFQANNLFLKENRAGMHLEDFSFEEISGFVLRELAFSLNLSDQATEITGLRLATNNSNLKGKAGLEYESIDDLINLSEKTKANLETTLRADIQDAYFFNPDLAGDSTLNIVARFPVNADLNVVGTLAKLDIRGVDINWGNETGLNARGTIGHPLDMELLSMHFPVLDFRTIREDLLYFVNEDEMGIRLPDEILLESEIKGNLKDMIAELRLQMPEGTIELDGHFVNTDHMAFDADLRVGELELNRLLQNDQLGVVDFNIHAEGKGKDLRDLDAVLTSNFEQLEYQKMDFSGLVLEGKMNNGKGELELSFQGDALDMDLKALAHLDSLSSQYQLLLDLRGADLFALGLTNKELRVGLNLDLTVQEANEEYDILAAISEGMVVYERRPFTLGPVNMAAHLGADTTGLDLSGEILNVNLRSNASPAELTDAIQQHLANYLIDSVDVDTVARSVEMEMNMGLNATPLIKQVFLEGLNRLDSVSMDIMFKEEDQLLTANLYLPAVVYNAIAMDSLKLTVDGNGTNLEAEFGLVSLEAGPLSMERTLLTGRTEDDNFHLDFRSFDGEEILIQLGARIGVSGDTLNIRMEPQDLILYKNAWSIPDNNQVLVADNLLRFENFVWKRGNQELSISNEVDGVDEDHIGISFKDFGLSAFTSLFNPDTLIASGKLNGDLILENIFAATGIVADFGIDDLKVIEVPLGNLSLVAASIGDNGYDFNLALKEGDIDLDLVGDYVAADSGANLNLKLALNEVRLKALEGLSGEQIRDAEGSISGTVGLSGTTMDPVYEGELRFNEAAFTVSTLNSRFSLSNEDINIDNSGLYLANFTITDEENNSFTLDGEVLTPDFINPVFNLSINAENFQALNSSEEDNDLFYGKVNLNADIDITGNLNEPIVKGRLRLNDETEFTFVIPETQLDLVERDGVVLFVDQENPDDILTKREAELTTSEIKGLELSAVVEIAPEAIFNVIVDERSGDNLQLGGEANLSVDMDPNGRITLSGKYELSKGHYEMSLYNLVSRRFEINPGSSVTWGGDPMDATLEITAIYEIETSASELMATQLSGADTEVATQFRQELPFLVYLNVNGELLRPTISFGLDMPEDERGAIGGNVYAMVQQVNAQEDELNKQVFSLLVLNRFFPATGSDGSGGGATAIARSSVSQMLSGQLNAFSKSLFGDSGLELDFDLDSFTDYQEGTAQDRTQLNVNAQQRLFNDRLIVQVGSQMDVEGSSNASERGNPIFGNVSVEYLLTENGRYRLRGFRKNEFESIIDGQLIVTGISLIFNREFNKFWELWKGIDPEENEEKNE